MSEYIKRSELAEILSNLIISPWATEGNIMRCVGKQDALHLVQDMVNDEVPDNLRLPAADVKPVLRARWEICSDGYYPYCSNCKNEPQGRVMTDFCPYCGADMREDAE